MSEYSLSRADVVEHLRGLGIKEPDKALAKMLIKGLSVKLLPEYYYYNVERGQKRGYRFRAETLPFLDQYVDLVKAVAGESTRRSGSVPRRDERGMLTGRLFLYAGCLEQQGGGGGGDDGQVYPGHDIVSDLIRCIDNDWATLSVIVEQCDSSRSSKPEYQTCCCVICGIRDINPDACPFLDDVVGLCGC